MTDWLRSVKQWGIPLFLAILAMVLGWQLRRPSDGANAHVTTITGVSSIVVNQNQQAFEVSRRPAGWVNVRHPSWQLDPDYIEQWLLAIQRVSIVRPISRDAPSEFGLVSPAMSIRLANTRQQVTTIKIGNRAPNGAIYILVNDSIYLAERESIRSIWKDAADFRDNRPFRKLVIGATHLIRIPGLRSADPVLTLDRGKATGLWYVNSTTNMIIESDRVSKLLGAIQSMSVFRYIP
ncbi:DUF4340 domain-containing protein, partial [bacterium]|nr:DUF4340 domain-containing protein [bacterium]